MKKPFITGYNGCSCHPFRSWDESDFFHNQKFEIGDNVKNRCRGITGTIFCVCDTRGFVIVKYGELPRDRHLEHVANLIKIQQKQNK